MAQPKWNDLEAEVAGRLMEELLEGRQGPFAEERVGPSQSSAYYAKELPNPVATVGTANDSGVEGAVLRGLVACGRANREVPPSCYRTAPRPTNNRAYHLKGLR